MRVKGGAGVLVFAVVALVAVAAVVIVLTRGEPAPEPVAIAGATVGADDRVEVWIDRCDSEPRVTSTSLERRRIIVEVVATAGSDQGCQDRLEVALVTDDIVELVDATSGQLFLLRVVPSEQADQTPITRQ